MIKTLYTCVYCFSLLFFFKLFLSFKLPSSISESRQRHRYESDLLRVHLRDPSAWGAVPASSQALREEIIKPRAKHGLEWCGNVPTAHFGQNGCGQHQSSKPFITIKIYRKKKLGTDGWCYYLRLTSSYGRCCFVKRFSTSDLWTFRCDNISKKYNSNDTVRCYYYCIKLEMLPDSHPITLLFFFYNDRGKKDHQRARTTLKMMPLLLFSPFFFYFWWGSTD